MTKRFPKHELERFVAEVMRVEGLPEADAADVARLMVAADMAGIDLHGIFGLTRYLPRLRAGGINKRPKIRIVRETASVALIDGDHGMGHLVGQFAARTAIQKASETGIGWSGTRNSDHEGAASVYATMPLEHGMAGIYGAVGIGKYVPPWGGMDKLLGTNPFAIAVPAAEGPPVVMDFATTVTSIRNARSKARLGEQLPEGWMIERDGSPLTDPTRVSEGLLLPIGGYKGYALGFVLGLLAGTLNGATMGEDAVDIEVDLHRAPGVGQFICALDLAALGDAGSICADVDRVAWEMRRSAPLPGFDQVQVPGDGRATRLRDREENGVPITDALRAELSRIAKEIGVRPLSG